MLPTEPRAWCLTQLTAAVGVRRPLPQNPGSGLGFGHEPCGSGLGRDAAGTRRRLRYRPQSRASSRPQPSAQGCARDLCGRQPLLPTAPRPGAACSSPPLPGPEDPSHRTPAPALDRARTLWERPWPRHGFGKSPASLQAAIASKLAPAAFGTGLREGPLWEAAIAAGGASTRRCAHLTAAVGVRRPLPQNPGSGLGSGTVPVGAALPATRLVRAAGFVTGRKREQARSHKTSRAPIPAATVAPSRPQIGDEAAQA